MSAPVAGSCAERLPGTDHPAVDKPNALAIIVMAISRVVAHQTPLAGEADGDAGQDRLDARPRQDRHFEQLQQLVADPDGGDVVRAQAEHAAKMDSNIC